MEAVGAMEAETYGDLHSAGVNVVIRRGTTRLHVQDLRSLTTPEQAE